MATTAEVHLSDIGTIFEITLLDGTTAVDISAATVMQIIFKKPDNRTILTKTAVFTTSGTDGKLQYVTISGDLDQIGTTWQVQAAVTLPTGSWRSDISTFTVFTNL